jgi:hypothetical protein
MALSRIAAEFAAEIKQHDWSDAPYRLDRAGHDRETDTNRGPDVLSVGESMKVRTNVMWVAAQVLGYSDPNFDVHEFAAACGVHGIHPGFISGGIRNWNGHHKPGTYDPVPA